MANHVEVAFGRDFEGTVTGKHGSAELGKSEGKMTPYDMLLGALAGCYYSTFLDIVPKMKLEFERVDIIIDGVKRTEVPTTLETVDMKIIVRGAEGERKRFDRALDLAAKYCSIHETISRVAQINRTVQYI